MLEKGLVLYLDKMKKYYLGKNIGNLEITNENGVFYGSLNNIRTTFSGESQEEIKDKVLKYFMAQRNDLLDRASEFEEISTRLKENGLEKTSKHYQALQIKLEEIK